MTGAPVDEQYERIDLPFYREHVAPVLPDEVLDFHAHTWMSEQWKEVPWQTDAAGGKYIVVEKDYGVDRLEGDLKMMFPDKTVSAVCFGYPTPAADVAKTNDYMAEVGKRKGMFPLMLAGRDLVPREELERGIVERGFYGYKVFLAWYGDDYGDIQVEDMIGPAEMSLANERSLVVLLHVPGSERLADPRVQKGVEKLAKEYPEANIVLAHAGRCFLPDQMRAAIGSVAKLENVSFDVSMVMDTTVLQMVIEGVGPRRVLFASDLPVAAMRGRRVYVMNHWVDVVAEGYQPSGYRVPAKGVPVTFMMYEIVLAIRRAAEMAGLSDAELKAIYGENGFSLLRQVQRK